MSTGYNGMRLELICVDEIGTIGVSQFMLAWVAMLQHASKHARILYIRPHERFIPGLVETLEAHGFIVEDELPIPRIEVYVKSYTPRVTHFRADKPTRRGKGERKRNKHDRWR